MNENDLCKRRIIDAANKAYAQNIYVYTDFLSISELSVYNEIKKEISFIDNCSYGGNPACERQIIQFGSEAAFGYKEAFPITLIKISPLIEKFGEELSHRDYLGAVLNLGIERNLIGDIIIKGKTAYMYCVDRISDYIVSNLTKIKHTNIKCEITDIALNNLSPELEDIETISASLRIDAIAASLTRLSRSKVIELFRTEKIFVNGRLCENNSYNVHPKDIIVIRGLGKYIFEDNGKETKKGRIYVKLKHYK